LYFVTGIVDTQPKISGQAQIFNIGRINVIASRYPEINFGDRVKVTGQVDNNKILFPEIEILDMQTRKGFLTVVSGLRANLIKKINNYLPEPQSSLLSGMLLGNDQISKAFKTDLKDTGTLHIVVVSGQNVTIVAGFFMALAGLIRRQIAIIITFLAIFLYALLAGLEPPIIRAAIMGMIAYAGQFSGRQTWGFYSLAIAATFMLIFDPKLISSLSFILSFMATFGIIWLGPILNSLIIRIPVFKEEVSTAISAYLFTLPIIAYNFSQVSIISILANILVSIVIIPIMILGFVTVFVGAIITPLGQLLAWLVYVPLTYFILVVENLAKLPFASMLLGKFSIIFIALYYLIVIFAFKWMISKRTVNI
jgi:competence protein ComEC